MTESKLLRIFSVTVTFPCLFYLWHRFGFDVALAIFLGMWAQNCWMNANYIRDMEERYDAQEAAKEAKRKERNSYVQR